MASFSMAYNNVMLFFLFLKSTTLIARGNSDLNSRSSYNKTQENKELMGFVVKRFDSPTLLSCSRQCLTNLWCSSINFKFSLKKDDKGTCELNKHDISVLNENVYFDDRDGVTFSLLLRVIYLVLLSVFKIIIHNLSSLAELIQSSYLPFVVS